MYAVIETGGQQFKVQEGDLLKVEKLAGEVGTKVELDKVLLVNAANGLRVGKPYVAGAKVVGMIVEHARYRKVLIYKYRRRKSYHKKQGHRQNYTRLKIEQIIG